MSRVVEQVVKCIKTKEGGGFIVARPFPTGRLSHVDPFLLIDHMGPVNYGPGEAKGAPWHPHRGFQTVSYILQGELQHRDSMGNTGFLRAGDVQWMTAGSGIIHDEEPSQAMKEYGGAMEGFQIWVNLPQKDKMCDPEYQDVSRDKIPVAAPEDSKGLFDVRVIAGSAFGVQGAVQTRHPTTYLDFWAKKGASIQYDIPADQNVLIYVYRGKAVFGGEDGKIANQDECVLFELDSGSQIKVDVVEDDTKFLLLAGKPLNEPVARHGPFVMNTQAELRTAFQEYQLATFVKVKGTMKSEAQHATEYRPNVKDASIV